MIKLTRPKRKPKVLEDKGVVQTTLLCAAYEAASAFRDGTNHFQFDEQIYSAPDVRRSLHRAQKGKCAYCETKQGPFEVEHYRPKAGSRQSRDQPLTRPGYYWLAYEWQNLLYACVLCNQIRRDEDRNQTGKGNIFPVADPAQRARSHRDSLANETPLLLDPYTDDPSGHITYRRHVPVAQTPRGHATLETLSLKGGVYKARRLERYRMLLVCRKVLENSNLPPEIQEEIRTELLSFAADSAEYSAMSRSVLAAWGLLDSP